MFRKKIETKQGVSKLLRKILESSPRKVFAKGYLFRGVSERDYESIMAGKDLFARYPRANEPLIKHILDRTNYPDTQFISLTSDVDVARHFGERIIVVEIRKLKGVLLILKDIEQRTGGDTRVKRLVKKNSEFVLAPTKREYACIPAKAVVR